MEAVVALVVIQQAQPLHQTIWPMYLSWELMNDHLLNGIY
jgi:hypothetical protein